MLLLTRTPAYAYLNKIIVAEITSTIRGIAQEVSLDKDDGLSRRSVANLDNVHVIPKAALGDRLGRIAAARVITENDNDLMIISASGVVIRTDVNLIRVLSRSTQGVTLMHLGEGDTVVAVATTNGKKQDQDAEVEDGQEIEGDVLMEETNEMEARAHEAAPPVGRLMRGIVAYLNAMRQAFLNAGQGLSG